MKDNNVKLVQTLVLWYKIVYHRELEYVISNFTRTNVADAVPLQITQQGECWIVYYINDQDSNGTQLWTETLAVQFILRDRCG